MKTCIKCKREQDNQEFYLMRRDSIKRHNTCRTCQIEYQRTPERRKAQLKYRQSEKGIKAKRLFYILKRKPLLSKTYEKYGRNYNFKRNYGITTKEYDKMFTEQKGVCAICGKPETRSKRGKILRLCIDHNHNTKIIRGLLCYKCNAGLGNFDENIKYFIKAISYLDKTGKKGILEKLNDDELSMDRATYELNSQGVPHFLAEQLMR